MNLFRGGVADKPAGKYSGGMKRRLSVAISLIGSPKVHHFLLWLTLNSYDLIRKLALTNIFFTFGLIL